MGGSGPVAENGVIAAGTVNGKPWRVVLARSVPAEYGPCWAPPGTYEVCTLDISGFLKNWTGITGPANLWFTSTFFGQVRPDVSRISIELSDGAVLVEYPVAVFGHRWFGLAIPPGLSAVRVVAYSVHGQAGHSVAYPYGIGGSQAEFYSWLAPGDRGPARVTKVIGSGVLAGQPWSIVLDQGPWGNCVRIGPDERGCCRCRTARRSGSGSFMALEPGSTRCRYLATRETVAGRHTTRRGTSWMAVLVPRTLRRHDEPPARVRAWSGRN